MRFAAFVASALVWSLPVIAAELEVHTRAVDDLKAVSGTVETLHQTSARARIGGTITALAVTEGQRVAAGQKLAVVTDSKISLQTTGADARIQSAEAQLALAHTEFDRANELFTKGVGTRARVDTARAQLLVAERAVSAMRSDRNVLVERGGEGAVLAPANGRVLKVGVTEGSVVLPGDPVATIAVENFVLRVQLPERHARWIKVGDTVLVGARALSLADTPPRPGKVVKVYPQIDNGRVVADVALDGLGDYFVGERVPVHVATGTRPAFIVPRDAVHRRFGLDYVSLKDGTEVVVQLGQITADAVEVLSGLKDGDTLIWSETTP
jgi:membrane fusion protein, multidrug efflux system